MHSAKLLVRVARRMQQVWSAKASLSVTARYEALRRLRERIHDLDIALARVERARQRGPAAILPRLEEELPSLVQAALNAATQARHVLELETVIPDLAVLIPELQHLEVEFGGVRVDLAETTISVTTEPITLEGVHLGAFDIKLNWRYLAQDPEGAKCLTIVARNPNPAATDEDVTHPHVKYESLCAGDAKVPLRKAFEEGRLADAFILVQSVLSHYNPSSAHVRLDDWEGFLCHECGAAGSDDDQYHCDGCHNNVCSDCLGGCARCDNGRCGTCLSRCAVCEASCCSGCLAPCASTDKECCTNCLKPCAECEELMATDELTAEAGLCPDCAGDIKEEDVVPVAIAEAETDAAVGESIEPPLAESIAAAEEPFTSIPPETETHDATRDASLSAACA